MKLKLQPNSIRAAITANSYKAEDNTIEVVFATEFEAQRCTWDGTQFIEVLKCNPENVRLARLNAGLNLIDTHDTTTVDKIFGVVVRGWVENSTCKAIIRLSKRAEVQGIVGDIIDGIISNISVRYVIYGATQINNDNEPIKIEVTDWEPTELTACSVPVDFTAGVRSNENKNFYEINISNNRSMTPEEIAAAADAERLRGLQQQNTPTPPVTPVTPVAAAAPAPGPDANTIIASERARVQEITSCVRTANISDQAFLDNLINSGATADAARSAIFTHLQTNQVLIRGQHANISHGADEADKVRSAMSIAIEHRVNPKTELKEGAQDFRGMTMLELGKDCLERAGVKTRGMSRVAVAQAALNITRSVGMNSTSDFPVILGNTINRSLRSEYAVQPRTFTGWASQGVAQDFRDMTRAALGDFDDFQEVKEGGEYEYGTVGEEAEKYHVVKYGRLIAYTWEMMINDDLGAFQRIPRKIASAAARKQSDLVYAILTGNPQMSDNTALFHANHNNLATAAAIGIDSIGLMRKLFRDQTGIDKKDALNLTPEYLITGSANEQLALQYTSTNFTANVAGNVNVWAGLTKPIIEPRIKDKAWFFAASPGVIDTVEYSFLEGEGELFTTQREGFEVDGVEIKARMVFGCKALDFRGLAKNPGA